MLAGLLFATADADDRPEVLAATLPFCGSTLIEYQARLLLAVGATQVLVAVSRVTPALLGAVSRIERRGVTVDVVRSTGEAAAKAHPLARLLLLADGLVTTEPVLRALADGDGDALLVTTAPMPLPGLERLDARMCWAGVARLSASRLAEVARLPSDYDLQSALIRVAAAEAERVPLTPALAPGHGVERRGATLSARSNDVVAALAADREGWPERYLLAPLASLALPPLLARGVPDWALIVGGGGVSLAACVTLLSGWLATGMVLALLACLMLAGGSLLAWLGGEERRARSVELGSALVAAASSAMLGRSLGSVGLLLAVTLVIAAAIASRAMPSHGRRRWWGDPLAYLVVITVPVLAGQALPGLALAAVYAAATLANAVEKLRRSGLARP